MNDFREYIACCNSIYDYVKHHGIKGQQWGVRNGPPYPIEDKVLRKGTKLETVTRFYTGNNAELLRNWLEKNKRWMYTYRPEDEWDKKIYNGPFSRYLQTRIDKSNAPGRNPEVHTYTVKEDLKMPTKKERVDAFAKIMSSKNSKYIEELQSVQKILKDNDVNIHGSTDYLNVDLKNLKTDKDIKNAYAIFNHAMEASYAYEVTKKYCDVMAKNFDAMVDDNNQDIYNKAHDPIIIMKVDKLLSSPELSRTLTEFEIAINYYDVKEELSKSGEKVKW